ncbi:redox-sensitive transcriptional activator SoxR [Modestobacter sp. SYSU DS0875]
MTGPGAGAGLLSISEVSRRSGLSLPTLRFYESRGLVASVRGPGNKRFFARHVLRRLAVVAAAQRVGLSLAEIQQLLAEVPADRAPTTEEWSRLTGAWLARVDEAVAGLQRLRVDLGSCIGCGCLSLATCSLVNPGDAAGSLGAGARWQAPRRAARPDRPAPGSAEGGERAAVPDQRRPPRHDVEVEHP